MIETVEVVSIGRELACGATAPLLVRCRWPSGVMQDVIAKFSWEQCPPQGRARELVGCLLAHRVGLTAGSPVFVRLNADMLVEYEYAQPTTAGRIRRSVVPGFGSVLIPQHSTMAVHPGGVPATLIGQATEIWAFDELILNVDRNKHKPNCLTDGTRIAVIDHEKALVCQGRGFLFLEPWQETWKPLESHLFYDAVLAGRSSIDKLHQEWSTVSEADIAGIANAVQISWGVKSTVDKIVAYLYELRLNLDSAFANLKKVIA